MTSTAKRRPLASVVTTLHDFVGLAAPELHLHPEFLLERLASGCDSVGASDV
jgi:hypothetical protein